MDPDGLADPEDAPRSLVARAGAWLQATPVELAGLVLLLAGALVATGVVLWDAQRRPTELPPTARVGTAAEDPVHHDVDGTPQPTQEAEASQEVVVHVSGAVRRGGIVTLPAGSRVADAIAAAGGAATGAELDRLNLARILTDGEQVHVPVEGEPTPAPDEAEGGGGIDAEGRVDLNRASQEELETLPGIGPAKASAIIDHRETNGPFEVPGDLRAVPGIGERTFQQLADLVTVG
jgi:competence protein ComEA